MSDDNIATRVAARLSRGAAGAASLAVGLGALGAARAAQFQQAPTAKAADGDGGMPETLFGVIHVNTAFFIVVGVVAAVWFLLGGERKAKIGRK